jgi:glucosamine--fructose-6-phosphate aminotransferase (isomerizing)
MLASDPCSLYGARNKSPLVLAYNGREAILASDQAPILDLSAHVTYLEDGDIVCLSTTGAEVINIRNGNGLAVQRQAVARAAEDIVPSKGEYEHWMLKEMHEVPAVIEAALAVPYAQLVAAVPEHTQRLTLIGAGSAFYVTRLGQYFFSKIAGMSVHALPADEALYWTHFTDADALIAISQSGETFDTLEVCRHAQERGAWLSSITNVSGSTQERMADHFLLQRAGPEICVLSTKSVISQVTLLIRMAYALARRNGVISEAEYLESEKSLQRTPQLLTEMLRSLPDAFQELARRYAANEHWFFIGRGPLYPVALESALKFKEVSYKHAEGLPAGFFKHGTISLIDSEFFTVALLPTEDADHERLRATLANVSEIAARSGPVIGFGPSDLSADDRADFREYVELPLTGVDGPDLLIHLLAGQLFAYYCADELGREIDQPRSLAKSVTVR